jgi:hypothetical protein
MAGLISSAMPKQKTLKPMQPLGGTQGSMTSLNVNEDKPLSSLSGYNASQRLINPETDTVQGQIGGIIAQDSPLMQQAQTAAAKTANKRGLLNSSMAVQAGREATYNAALPIASADAGIYNDVQNRNMDAQNNALQFSSGAQNTGALQAEQGKQQIGAIAAQGEQQRLTGQQSGQQALEQIGAQGAQQSQLSAQQAQQAQVLETQRGEIQKQLLTAEGVQKEKLLAAQGAIDTQLQNLKGTQAQALQTSEAASQLALQGLRGEQANQIAQIEASYKTIMQTSDSAAKTFSQAASDINTVLIDPNISVESKQQIIDKRIQLLDAQMSAIGTIGNIDLSDILDFS